MTLLILDNVSSTASSMRSRPWREELAAMATRLREADEKAFH